MCPLNVDWDWVETAIDVYNEPLIGWKVNVGKEEKPAKIRGMYRMIMIEVSGEVRSPEPYDLSKFLYEAPKLESFPSLQARD